MPIKLPLRRVSDNDINNYSAYVQRLASRPATQPSAPISFRAWFQWKHKASPLDDTQGHVPPPPEPARASA